MTEREGKTVYCSQSGCANAARLRCGSCKLAYYCSGEHQKSDWAACHRKACKNFARLQGALAESERQLEEGTKRFRSLFENMETVLGRDAVAEIARAHDKTISLYAIHAQSVSDTVWDAETGSARPSGSSPAGARDRIAQGEKIKADFEEAKRGFSDKFQDPVNVTCCINVLNLKFQLIDATHRCRMRSNQIDNQGNAIVARNTAAA